jgi:uncharacterized protein YkwD
MLLRIEHKSLILYFIFSLFGVLSPGCGRDSCPNPVTPPDESGQGTDSTLTLTSCYQARDMICKIEASIVRLTNKKRAALGLVPLQQSYEASFVAREWAGTQLAEGNLSHRGFPDQRRTVLKREFASIDLFFRAENVAMGVPRATQAEEVAHYFVDRWWQSPGHKRNLTGPYAYLGAGISLAGETLSVGSFVYATQLFHN